MAHLFLGSAGPHSTGVPHPPPQPQSAAPPPRRDQRHLHLHVPMHIGGQGGAVEDEVLHHHIQGQSRSPVRNRLVQGTRWLLLSFQLLLREKNDSAGKTRCWGGGEGPSLGLVWEQGAVPGRVWGPHSCQFRQ